MMISKRKFKKPQKKSSAKPTQLIQPTNTQIRSKNIDETEIEARANKPHTVGKRCVLCLLKIPIEFKLKC